MTQREGASDTPADSAQEIFTSVAYEAAQPPRREFAPWHRPRKQLVRNHQWLQQTERLLNELPRSSPVKYLGLPGVDLLDIRALYKVVCPEREFLFLGFNTRQDNESRTLQEISLQEVKAREHVADGSIVMTDDLRTLGKPNSVGLKRATDVGPFDIVNLDFCDNVLGGPVGDMSVYNAILRLFGLQNRRKDPWLLFITTRIDRAALDSDVQSRLDELLASNHDSCEEFAAAVSDLSTDNAVPALATCGDEEWVDIFCVALAKWMLRVAADHSTSLEIKSTMSYRVATNHPTDDLISVAYRLSPSPAPIEDAAGLAEPAVPLDYCRLAAALPAQVKRRARIDTQLASDDGLREQMTNETAELLVEARYDEAAYRAWLARDTRAA